MTDDEGRGEVRRSERRRRSSRRGVGSVAVAVAVVFEAVEGLLVVLVGAVRSRVLSVVRRRWDFAARVRAVFKAWGFSC